MLYYAKTAEQTLKDLDVSRRGLAISEAAERLQVHGPNTVKVSGEPLWRKLIEPFANVFMIILLFAAIVSFFQRAYLDGTIILIIMTASAVIYYIQKFSTERILRSLRKHDRHMVSVLRDNKIVSCDASQLVPGDIITLNEGEKIPADARLIEADSLRVDESQLTGESQPINKQAGKLTGDKEVYEQSNMLFQGSFIVAGEAVAVITSTGNNTEFGKLAALTTNLETVSPVQKKIDKLIAQIIGVVAGLALVAFGLANFRGMELTESFRFVIALSVSAVPEGLPVAISVILVLGMRRMAAKKALVRSMRAIETIGVITTIATDKTGTLTKNKLTVGTVWQPSANKNFAQIISQTINTRDGKMHDPLDTALLEYAKKEKVKQSRQLPAESFPFDHATSMSGNLWHNGETLTLSVKGAPEVILAASDLSENEREQATAALQQLSSKGYRVIAIAHHTLKKEIATLNELPKNSSLQFDGFVGVADILRPEALRAIKAAQKAGVSVRMITGDHFETAFHIGKQLGMASDRSQVFDSRKMSVMTDEELEKIIDKIRVFSRVTPERKYRLLALLKKHNVTAMTGDGVNDVPALASAHVGVAMGSGAGIAKDAGDIILLDDDFKSIVDAIREGRRIFANIRRMLYYLLSTNAGEVLTMVGSLVIGLPVPLLPVQILWINLVTDTSMVIPLGLEPGEKAQMTDGPRRPNAPILGKFIISRMVLVALTMASLTLGLYAYYSSQFGHEYGRTIAFSALVVMQWANAFCARSEYQSMFSRLRVFNSKFYAGLTLAISLQLLVLFGPLGGLLHIKSVAIGDLIISGAIAFIIPILLVEVHKFLGRRRYVRP
jgi:P-type Ca2+ transporter type 2C